jgi:hypothetical protein
MKYKDYERTCKRCKQVFIFTAAEQEEFAKLGFKHPKLCRPCRALRRQEREHEAQLGQTQG